MALSPLQTKNIYQEAAQTWFRHRCSVRQLRFMRHPQCKFTLHHCSLGERLHLSLKSKTQATNNPRRKNKSRIAESQITLSPYHPFLSILVHEVVLCSISEGS